MAEKLVKCRYKHCKHPEDYRPPDEMVHGNGSVYYHKECAHERDTINKIIEYYTSNIDDRVTLAQLRGAVNNIIFKKNVPADELLFDLMFVHNNGNKINSPYSLHYIVANKRIQHEYKKHLESLKPKTDVSKISTAKEVCFSHKSPKRTGWDDI
jgi:hypothetical protein